MSVIKPMVSNIARWLRIGGAVAVEHDDTNGAQTAGLFSQRRVFGEVAEHPPIWRDAHDSSSLCVCPRMSKRNGHVLPGRPGRTRSDTARGGVRPMTQDGRDVGHAIPDGRMVA